MDDTTGDPISGGKPEHGLDMPPGTPDGESGSTPSRFGSAMPPEHPEGGVPSSDLPSPDSPETAHPSPEVSGQSESTVAAFEAPAGSVPSFGLPIQVSSEDRLDSDSFEEPRQAGADGLYTISPSAAGPAYLASANGIQAEPVQGNPGEPGESSDPGTRIQKETPERTVEDILVEVGIGGKVSPAPITSDAPAPLGTPVPEKGEPYDVLYVGSDTQVDPANSDDVTVLSSGGFMETGTRSPERELPSTDLVSPDMAGGTAANPEADLSPAHETEPVRRAGPRGMLDIGTMLGHFRITKFIGGGGMGRVYEADDTALDRKVAIKVLAEEHTKDKNAVARFLNEAKSAARLNHEHIAQVYFCGQDRGIPFIAFEYVEGENLRSYVVEHGMLDARTAIQFGLQVTGALSHAAANGVIHRDVKPSNIIITPQGKAKLIDMGLARIDHQDGDLTVSGVTLGTFDYISPEQAYDPRNVDVRSDIYSLGCTFFFMMTGRPPFTEGTYFQKLLQRKNHAPPDIRDVVPDTPEDLAAIVRKMMAKNKEDRYLTPDDLVVDLKKVARQLGVATGEPVPRQKGLPKGTKRRIFLRHLPWISAVVLLLAFAGAYYLSGRNGSRYSNLPPSATRHLQPTGVRGQGRAGDGDPPVSPSAPENPQEPRPSFAPSRVAPRGVSSGVGTLAMNAAHSASMPYPHRVQGGMGMAPLSSGDIVGSPEFQNLSPGVVRAAEIAVAPTSDLFSDNWSVLKPPVSGQEPVGAMEPTLPEGTDPVVDGRGKKAGYYATLEEAVAQVVLRSASSPSPMKEATVKIAMQGDLPVSSMTLSDCALRIAPASGYTPRIIFAPSKSAGSDAIALFNLRKARITLVNVAVSFDLNAREFYSDEWSLVRFDPRSSVEVADCSLTIRNESEGKADRHPNAAFFRLRELPPVGARSPRVHRESSPSLVDPYRETQTGGSSGFLSSGERTVAKSALDQTSVHSLLPPGAPSVSLNGSFVRGEAVLLDVRSIPCAGFEVSKSVLAVDSPCVRYDEGGSAPPQDSDRLGFSMSDSLCWCSGSIFEIVHRSLNSDGSDNALAARIYRSLLVLSDRPVGSVEYAIPRGSLPAPAWFMPESIVANASALVHCRGVVGSSGDAPFMGTVPLEGCGVFQEDSSGFAGQGAQTAGGQGMYPYDGNPGQPGGQNDQRPLVLRIPVRLIRACLADRDTMERDLLAPMRKRMEQEPDGFQEMLNNVEEGIADALGRIPGEGRSSPPTG